jgi:hypothetical protein
MNQWISTCVILFRCLPLAQGPGWLLLSTARRLRLPVTPAYPFTLSLQLVAPGRTIDG